MVTYEKSVANTKVGAKLDFFCENRPDIGGRVMVAGGANVLADRSVIMPGVCWVDRQTHRGLTEGQLTSYKEPLSPTFAMEIDFIISSPRASSKRRWLEEKTHRYFNLSACRLLWLVDPVAHVMIVYRRTANGYEKDEDETWRDLDGEDVLPGFVLKSQWLEQTVNQDPGSSESENEHIRQCPDCPETFHSKRLFILHFSQAHLD